ncbi:signal transduction histidine kinase [Roseivirga ehrenbergii]|uniref:histidine kinase n=1 Tax=Roseivirga ehrenbergii (strain DSM 102268 / JCM 13514 / KCTC 12282 / NCIMB 14502 / KMM 6017) TaxID=279360 RepID=A0A150WZ26_ROSEK|nr:ATP-binding protein [Roseivirga ehrenbergii]KYG71727.1 histidine kinase [Roseivirga ehrenbergii]TCL07579.1 signal transduction histidine kinase [Roseivirga ehrenbergii]
MKLNFKNRIALYYTVATAIITALAFLIVFLSVKKTVFSNLDKELSYQAQKHSKEIIIENDSIHFMNKAEWAEREHREVQVNPVFIQLINNQGQLMDKSPNLKEQQLSFLEAVESNDHFSTFLVDRAIRQAQIPIEKNGRKQGYIITAISMESSTMVIKNLQNTLLISFPIVLFGLYLISSSLAGRSITPLQAIIDSTNTITKNNLNERVPLPPNKDEIFELSSAINELLQRIENAIQRERQFTSDASHELRTPLSTLRGTLEVLIRKPRTQSEYEEKVQYGLSEIDRMSNIVEQLLLLARFDSKGEIEENHLIPLVSLVDEVLSRNGNTISQKNLKVNFEVKAETETLVPQYYASLILENIIINAIKYSLEGKTLSVEISEEEKYTLCKISDQGIGIKQEDLSSLFNPFFRSDALEHKQITGAGLGLSIAKKAVDAIGAQITVESKINKGTTFTIAFLRKP